MTDIVARAPVYDIHTHLYDPAFGELLLWGIDELLTYHYLIAEGFRQFDLPYETFWQLSKTQQADAIWKALFIERSPI
ncbi:MAG TPA: glucuronate isomerase, partial [Chthoniobacteraceae bacterium]|nr:glucuronate isomerase [Chthoniobacteraceae bacterium]